MKILHVISNLSGGGAERQLSYLAPELVKRGHSVHLAYLHEGPDTTVLPKYEGAGVEMHQIKVSSNYDPRILLQTYYLIRQTQPDLVQSWMLHYDVIAAIVTTITNCMWIRRESIAPALSSNAGIKILIREKLVGLSNAVVANSLSGMDYWGGKYPHKLVCLIRNGFPVEGILQSMAVQFDFLPPNEQQNRYILFVGRFALQKNVGALLNALCHIPSDIKMILCGIGQLKAEYKKQIAMLNLKDRVIFLEGIDNKKVWALMRQVCAFALVSHFEGFPNVLVEAMLNRCPLIVSDIAPHRELLNETTACFVNKDDSRDIADGILRILNDPQGNTLQINNAFQVASQFSIKRMSDEYEALYDRLCFENK